MRNTIKWHLAHLTRFAGREARGVFWPYVGMVVLFQIALSWVLMIPVVMVVARNLQDFVQIQEDQMAMGADSGSAAVAAEQMQAHLLPLFGWIMLLSAVMFAVVLVLLSAAVARRLHDSGRAGIWGLLPLPFLVISNGLMMWLFSGGVAPGTGPFMLLFGCNALYLMFLLVLIVFLVMPGTAQDNRYGAMPAARL